MGHRRSGTAGYGRGTVVLHWASAVVIVSMLPLGFLMQDATGASKLLSYKAHVLLGCLLLALTLGRIVLRATETTLGPPPGLSGLHVRGIQVIHGLLYAALIGLTVLGLVLVAQSGLSDVLRGTSEGSIPVLDEFSARAGHAAIARIYIGLLVAHIGGVILHQIRHGGAFARIGFGRLGRSE